MTASFDTVDRTTIMSLLKDARCSEDDLRIIRYLLANTKLRVKVNNAKSAEFELTRGSFQGDGISGNLFNVVHAGALNHLRAVTRFRRNPPITNEYMHI